MFKKQWYMQSGVVRLSVRLDKCFEEQWYVQRGGKVVCQALGKCFKNSDMFKGGQGCLSG